MNPYLYENNGRNFYDNFALKHIDGAIAGTIAAARDINQKVTLTFNFVSVIATPKTEARALRAEWDKACAQGNQQSETCPVAGRASRQDVIDNLVDVALVLALERGVGGLVDWLKDYVGTAEDASLDRRGAEIATRLRAAGYAASVPSPAYDPETYARDTGRYIAGKVIDKLDRAEPLYWIGFIDLFNQFDRSDPGARPRSIQAMRPLAIRMKAAA